MAFLGIRWIGVTRENGQTLLFSLALIAIVIIVSGTILWLAVPSCAALLMVQPV